MARNRTRKQRAANINVRSDKSLELLNRTITTGPLTIIFAKLEGCGPCERFNDSVWSPLSKLKNRKVNMAMVDSQMVTKAGLPAPSAYPTLMLVGKDGKPATFTDEQGNTSHSLPRQDTLSEDKEALKTLIQNPTVKTSTPNTSMYSPNRLNSQASKSPFTEQTPNTLESIGSQSNKTPKVVVKQIPTSSPPDITADLVLPQTQTRSLNIEPKKGGKLLNALRTKVSSMKALLRLRDHHLSRKYRK